MDSTDLIHLQFGPRVVEGQLFFELDGVSLSDANAFKADSLE
jgi:hypothetical protein